MLQPTRCVQYNHYFTLNFIARIFKIQWSLREMYEILREMFWRAIDTIIFSDYDL